MQRPGLQVRPRNDWDHVAIRNTTGATKKCRRPCYLILLLDHVTWSCYWSCYLIMLLDRYCTDRFHLRIDSSYRSNPLSICQFNWQANASLLIYLNNVFLGVPGEAGRIPSPRVTGAWPLHRLRTCGLHFPHSSAHLLDSDVHFPGSTAFFSYQPQSLKSLAPRFTPQAWCYGILGINSATVFNDFGHHFRCSF